MAAGGKSVIAVASTTATAGIIVGVVTLTGLGLKIAGLIVAFAGGHLFLTVLYSAFAVLVLGLAVPVTASYIIAAVMVAPAMVAVGVPEVAAHMFIFYYAVLSEVSPPTALSPIAAAAITGGRQLPTMMLTWKYTLPAFVFPFAFTLSPQGLGLLLQAPLADILISTGTAALGVTALSAGLGGWIRDARERLRADPGRDRRAAAVLCGPAHRPGGRGVVRRRHCRPPGADQAVAASPAPRGMNSTVRTPASRSTAIIRNIGR